MKLSHILAFAGQKGGRSKSDKKRRASRRNGKSGGRPRKNSGV